MLFRSRFLLLLALAAVLAFVSLSLQFCECRLAPLWWGAFLLKERALVGRKQAGPKAFVSQMNKAVLKQLSLFIIGTESGRLYAQILKPLSFVLSVFFGHKEQECSPDLLKRFWLPQRFLTGLVIPRFLDSPGGDTERPSRSWGVQPAGRSLRIGVCFLFSELWGCGRWEGRGTRYQTLFPGQWGPCTGFLVW